MTIEEAKGYRREHWPDIRSQLLKGTYQPQPVKRVEIPKPDGGVRKIGVPCVVDRLIEQALLQVLQERWDPMFSEHSYGFRPGRSAHQAVAQAQQYVAEGYSVVVDLDLEKFFDRVNHDGLMARVAARVSDKRVRKLIRAFLEAGVMEDGLVSPVEEGTPQGGPVPTRNYVRQYWWCRPPRMRTGMIRPIRWIGRWIGASLRDQPHQNDGKNTGRVSAGNGGAES